MNKKDEFDKRFSKLFTGFIFVWIIAAIGSLALTGAFIYFLIKLASHL